MYIKLAFLLVLSLAAVNMAAPIAGAEANAHPEAGMEVT